MKWLAICAALAGFAAGMLSRDSEGGRPSTGIHVAGPAAPAMAAPELSNPVAQIITALKMRPGLRQLAELSESLERLSGAQMAELLDRMDRDSRVFSDYHVSWLFQRWLERDRHAASAWALPRLTLLAQDGPLGFAPGNSNHVIIEAWARQCRDEALDLARAYPRSGLAASVLYHVLVADRANPPGNGWAVLRDFPEGRAKAVEAPRFLAAWAKQNARAAFAAVEALAPGKTRPLAFAAVLPALAAVDPVFAFEHYNQLGRADPSLVAKMIAGAASKDPVAVSAWLLGFEPGQFAQAAPWLVDAWAAQDPAAALTWAMRHSVSFRGSIPIHETFHYEHTPFGRDIASGSAGKEPDALATALAKHPEATLAWFRALAPSPRRDHVAEVLVGNAGPDQALELFPELREGAQARTAFEITRQLAKKNPERAIQWAGSLPTGRAREKAWFSLGRYIIPNSEPPQGPDRDAWLHGKTQSSRITGAGPEAVLNLVSEIGNPAKRREVFDRAMQDYQTQPYNRLRALEWVEKSNLPNEWKEKWRAK